ncbi:MAG: lipoate--protein ligase family protein [Thermoguttaceae bacterium]
MTRVEMRYVDLTLPTPAENLALDEALLDEAEACGEPLETLRLWESPEPIVVVGRSSQIAVEVRRDECRRLGVPIVRRVSGGAAIVAGRGCLMYALVLSYRRRPELRSLGQAHRSVLGMLIGAIRRHAPGVHCCGTSDLALDGRKFSGNSVRCHREHLLYHGTLLYDFSLRLVEKCLAMPPRTPDYRAGRSHGQFLTNLPMTGQTLRGLLREGCGADRAIEDWPAARTARLVAEKYGRPEWNDPVP